MKELVMLLRTFFILKIKNLISIIGLQDFLTICNMEIEKVEVHEGCYGTTVKINDLYFENINKEIIEKYIIDNLKNYNNLQEIFIILAEDLALDSDYESYDSCETCGAWRSTTTYKMK
jgi:hypothetical protein